jgi:hypothetical protein
MKGYGLSERSCLLFLAICYVTGAVIPVDGGLMARNA